jgi:CubicO group peptidase (beta-lactamase class C family)
MANGKRITPPGYIAAATRKEIDNGAGGYGYFWWIRPTDAYSAIGIFGQGITTYPADHLIIVQNAAWPAPTGKELSAAEIAMMEGVRAAAK